MLYGFLHTGRLTELAASGGYIHILNWMQEIGFPVTGYHPSIAAAQAHQLETLKWMKQNTRAVFDVRCFIWAARNKDFEMMKWLKEINCPWTALVTAWAARTDLEARNWPLKFKFHFSLTSSS
jgi:hypothetical protein